MNEDLQQRLALLRAQYHQQFPQRLVDIEAQWRQLSKNGKQAAEAGQQLLRLLHGMAGSGTTFGFPQITEAADNALYKAKHSGRNKLVLAQMEGA